jgi:hypothetical protein
MYYGEIMSALLSVSMFHLQNNSKGLKTHWGSTANVDRKILFCSLTNPIQSLLYVTFEFKFKMFSKMIHCTKKFIHVKKYKAH